jgi:protein-disulfide isomerase
MSRQATLEHRRAVRVASERAQAARAQRRRRLWRLAAAGAAAAVLVAVAILVASPGAERAPRAEQTALFAGLPERNGVLGDPSAPLTVTEYLDPQCPVRASSLTLPGRT